MALLFIGVDPSTGDGDSPTVWVDQNTNDIIIQGYKADELLRQQVTATPPPGHTSGIPGHEDVVRIPARLVESLRKACDVAEGLD